MVDLDRILRENIRIMAQVVTEICQRNTRIQVHDQPMSRNQYYILNILTRSGEHPIGELARILDISTAATSKNIDRLESRGLVARRVSAADRRTTVVRLQPAGKAVVDEFDRVTAEKQKPMLESFTEEEKILLLDFLRRVVRYTLAGENQSDLICLQCGGACGNACAVANTEGICLNRNSTARPEPERSA